MKKLTLRIHEGKDWLIKLMASLWLASDSCNRKVIKYPEPNLNSFKTLIENSNKEFK